MQFMRLFRLMMFLVFTVCWLAACGEGDFDQRLRGEIDQLRAESFTDINSNPRDDPATAPPPVTGDVTTGGHVDLARVLLHPILDNGTADLSEAAILGNGISRVIADVNDGGPATTRFTITVRRPYAGAILVRVLPFVSSTERATVAHPAMGLSSPRIDMQAGEELQGYCPDYPNNGAAVVVSPLTTLVMERARHMGGLSSGNCSLASRQIGQFFGLPHVRRSVGNNLLTRFGGIAAVEAEDMAQAAIAQLAAQAGVGPLAVLRALVLDVRDDGELNGTAGLIPGSAMVLPSLSQASFLGEQLLEQGWLAANNDENHTNYSVTRPYLALATVLDHLDTARTLDGNPQELVEVSQAFTAVSMPPGSSIRMGLRGFTLVDGVLYLVASSDGPSSWNRLATSSAPGVVSITPDGRLQVSPLATPGLSATISVRIRADGFYLSGAYDKTFQIQVSIVAP